MNCAFLFLPVIVALSLLFAACGRPERQEPEPANPAAKQIEIKVDRNALGKSIPLTGYRPESIAFADDNALLAALDLDRPELGKVNSAQKSGDTAGAIKALAAHFRQRTTPRLVLEGKETTPVSVEVETKNRLPSGSMAEQALTRDYKIAGIAHKFEGAIDWELNPTTQPGYKGAWSSQFHTQLNRMHHWRELAEAWRNTGNPEYKRELLAQMAGWREKIIPPALEDVPKHIVRYQASSGNVRQFRLWLPLDVGQRTSNTVRVFEALRRDNDFDERSLIETVKMIAAHARLLTQLDIEGNHLAIATAGLATAAVMFPEFKDSSAWLTEAVARVIVEMEAQVYPDGAQMELTPWYHFTALRNFAVVLEAPAANGIVLPKEPLAGLRNMFEYIGKISDPLGAAPPLNDAEYLKAESMRLALSFYPEDRQMKWFATAGAEGSAPEYRSLVIPYAGQAVMRSGWGREDLYLLMEYGPFGTGHMHEDKLGLSVTAHGRRMLVDAGRNKYEASVMRDFSVNASAHSTVLFDGLFQGRRLAKGQLNRVSEPAPVLWRSDERFDYVAGSFGVDEREVFALPTDPPGNVAPEHFRIVHDERLRGNDVQITKRMIQRRHVLFVKPHYWIVADTFDPLDGEPHDYTTILQFGEGEAAVADNVVRFGKPDEPGMTAAFSSRAGQFEAAVIRGQMEPFIMGWIFSDGEPRPAPSALFKHKAAGRHATITALMPRPAGAGAFDAKIEWLGEGEGRSAARITPSGGLPAVEIELPLDGSAASWKVVGEGAE